MNKIVGVKFETETQLKYYYIGKNLVKKDDKVVVSTDKGLELGKVVTDVHPIDDKKLKKELPSIIRLSTKKDFINYKENKKLAGQALKKCKKIVKEMNLEMDVIEAYFTLDKDHLIFNFYADNRVDFRELAKELAYIYKTRIELRQIGVRDKAKKIGGLGCCGRELCCAKFLNKFDSVTISMAKNQNLSLNPNKINGVCGRLLCCLKYEDEIYSLEKERFPKIGSHVKYQDKDVKVTGLNVINDLVKIETNNGIVFVGLDEIKFDKNNHAGKKNGKPRSH